MMELEANKSANAHGLKDGVQRELTHVPVNEDWHKQTFRHLFARGTHGHQGELADGGAIPISFKVTTSRPSTVTEVAFQ